MLYSFTQTVVKVKIATTVVSLNDEVVDERTELSVDALGLTVDDEHLVGT